MKKVIKITFVIAISLTIIFLNSKNYSNNIQAIDKYYESDINGWNSHSSGKSPYIRINYNPDTTIITGTLSDVYNDYDSKYSAKLDSNGITYTYTIYTQNTRYVAFTGINTSNGSTTLLGERYIYNSTTNQSYQATNTVSTIPLAEGKNILYFFDAKVYTSYEAQLQDNKACTYIIYCYPTSRMELTNLNTNDNWDNPVNKTVTATIYDQESKAYLYKAFYQTGQYNFSGTINGKTYSARIAIDTGRPTGGFYGSLNKYGEAQKLTFFCSDDGDSFFSNNCSMLFQKDGGAWLAYDGKEVSNHGHYLFKAIDKAGNSSIIYDVKVDTIGPTISVNAGDQILGNGSITNKDVTINWDEDDCSATLNGNPYNKGTVISVNEITTQTYYFEIFDRVGNKSSYNFTIDKVPPSGTLSTSRPGGFLDSRTNENVSFTWNEENCSATLDGNVYKKNEIISNEGNHTIILTDFYGNSSYYYFTIDLSKANYSIISENGETLQPQSPFNEKLYLSWTDSSCSAILNGNPYISGTLIGEGNYSFYLKNSLGTKNEYAFTIDLTPPTENYNYFFNNFGVTINHWFTSHDYLLSSNQYIKNNIYSFINIDEARKFALNREWSIIETGTWFGGNIYSETYQQDIPINLSASEYEIYSNGSTYYVYKNIEGKLRAFFKDTELETSISHYVETSLTEKYITSGSSKAINPYPGDQQINNFKYYASHYDPVGFQNIYLNIMFTDEDVYFPYSPKNNRIYFLSGETYIEKSYSDIISEPGKYVIKEVDFAGNETIYTIYLDKEKSKINVFSLDNLSYTTVQQMINNQNISYITNEIKIKATDDADENCLLIVNHNEVTSKLINDFYVLNESGTYNVSTIDRAGNVLEERTIVLSLEEISIGIQKVYDENNEDVGFYLNIDKSNSINKIESITVNLLDTDTNINTLLSVDSDSKTIATQTLNYYFSQSGIYTISISDNFARSINKQIQIIRGFPNGALYTYDGAVLQTGGVTNQKVSLSWNDTSENIITAKIIENDLETVYNKNTWISAEKDYLIKLTNSDGKSAFFSFTIDKTPANGSFYTSDGTVITNYSGTNDNTTYFTWDEDKCRAYLVKEIGGLEIKTSYLKNTAFDKDGIYNIVLYDQANNPSNFQIEIDTTPVSVTINSSTREYNNGDFINKNFSFNWNDSKAIATVNGSPYLSGTSLKEDKLYILTITDKYNNKKTYYATRDTLKANGKFISNDEIISDNSYISNDFYFTWDEEFLSCFYQISGSDVKTEYEKNTKIEDSNNYIFLLTDRAGNVNQYTISLQKNEPVGKIKTYDGEIPNNSITNKTVYFTWLGNDNTATVNGQPYIKNDPLKDENIYIIVLTSKNKVSKTYTVTIDKTKPIGTLRGVLNGGVTNEIVYFTWEGDCSAYLDDVAYTFNMPIILEGKHEILLISKAGNKQTYSFEISNINPEGVLHNVNSLGFGKNVYFTWDKTKDYEATINEEKYEYGEEITENGVYKITLIAPSGAQTYYHFSIDDSVPLLEINGVEPGGITDNDVVIEWDPNNNYRITLNDEEYHNGLPIILDGKYILICTDEKNNIYTINFEIDKTDPIFKVKGLDEGKTKTNETVYITWDKQENLKVTVNEKLYQNNEAIKESGTYQVTLTDLCGNTSFLSFIIQKEFNDSLIVINQEKGNENTIINEIEDENIYPISFEFGEEIKAKINGVEYLSGTLITEPNTYEIEFEDLLGNKKRMYFEIESINSGEKDYTLQSIATILIGLSICVTVGVVLIMKLKGNDKNPFKKK